MFSSTHGIKEKASPNLSGTAKRAIVMNTADRPMSCA